jgi:hypothetical protein
MMDDGYKSRVSEETFDDFLVEQGMLENAEDVAIARVMAWQTSGPMAPPAVPQVPSPRFNGEKMPAGR